MKYKVPIKKFILNQSWSWQEAFEKLEIHHKLETELLIKEIERLEAGKIAYG